MRRHQSDVLTRTPNTAWCGVLPDSSCRAMMCFGIEIAQTETGNTYVTQRAE